MFAIRSLHLPGNRWPEVLLCAAVFLFPPALRADGDELCDGSPIASLPFMDTSALDSAADDYDTEDPPGYLCADGTQQDSGNFFGDGGEVVYRLDLQAGHDVTCTIDFRDGATIGFGRVLVRTVALCDFFPVLTDSCEHVGESSSVTFSTGAGGLDLAAGSYSILIDSIGSSTAADIDCSGALPVELRSFSIE